MHNAGYIHRDIKPENFLAGVQEGLDKVFLIDFGLAKRYIDAEGNHIKEKLASDVCGTPAFASLNCHNGMELSRRDDLISLFYVLVWFAKDKLPWSKARIIRNINKIKASKQRHSLTRLCKGLPRCFLTFAEAISALKFKDQPDYGRMIHGFQDFILAQGLGSVADSKRMSSGPAGLTGKVDAVAQPVSLEDIKDKPPQK